MRNDGKDMSFLDPVQRGYGSIGITSPAVVQLVGYVLLALVILLPFKMYAYDPRTDKYEKRPYNFGQRLLILLILFFPFFLGVYSVNCMMVGNCLLWSWIVAVTTLLWACIVIITAIHYQAFRLDDMMY